MALINGNELRAKAQPDYGNVNFFRHKFSLTKLRKGKLGKQFLLTKIEKDYVRGNRDPD
jgi:hypothetical protein